MPAQPLSVYELLDHLAAATNANDNATGRVRKLVIAVHGVHLSAAMKPLSPLSRQRVQSAIRSAAFYMKVALHTAKSYATDRAPVNDGGRYLHLAVVLVTSA